MKKNYCEIDFLCVEPNPKRCVYFDSDGVHDECKYMNLSKCESKIAQVNRMTIMLKKEIE